MKSAPDWLKETCITVLGSGHLRPASGTWGSGFACAIYAGLWWLSATFDAPRWAMESVTVVGILLSSWISVIWGEWAIERFKRKDPSQFVLDEFAGQWIALLWLPIAANSHSLTAAGFWTFCWIVGVQFVLFRILDVIKPPPARQFENLPAGWGILCDDLMSGAYALIIGQIIWHYTPAAQWIGL